MKNFFIKLFGLKSSENKVAKSKMENKADLQNNDLSKEQIVNKPVKENNIENSSSAEIKTESSEKPVSSEDSLKTTAAAEIKNIDENSNNADVTKTSIPAQQFITFQAAAHGEKYKTMVPPKPWQDYLLQGKIELKEKTWSVSIVSDGAGSSEHSEKASKFCCTKLYELCTEYINSHQWMEKDELPDEESWHISSKYFFDQTHQELYEFAKQNNLPEGSFNCTLILVLETPQGFLSANIGDGRAGFKSEGVFNPLIVPYQTFTVGATQFLANQQWELFFRSYKHDINIDKVDYYIIASDGCEYFWDTTGISIEKGSYDDVTNEPFYDENLLVAEKIEPIVSYLKDNLTNDFKLVNNQLNTLIKTGILDQKETDFKTWIENTIGGKDDKAIILHVRK